jgi:hypothetical protein
MSNTKQKQIRLSEQGQFFLGACKAATGFSDTAIMEVCLALYAMKLGQEVRRAHEHVYQTLVTGGDAQQLAAYYRNNATPTPATPTTLHPNPKRNAHTSKA